jgi:hypothetical protein
MALSKIQPASMDLTANYAFTGTNSVSSIEYAQKKLATQTASSSSTLSFTSGIDGTYNIYKFRLIDIHVSNDGADLTFQASTNTGSSYGVTATTSFFGASHGEGGAGGQVSYTTSMDKHNSTDFLPLNNDIGSDNDQSAVAELFLFGPSSTTFVKNFLCRTSRVDAGDYAVDIFMSGYFNTTSAIDAIQFKMDAGTIDSGTIEMYGIN